MNTTDTLNLAPEVQNALKKYNTAIDGALEAAQKLEAIAVTAHLAELFGANENQTAQAIKEDYLVAA